MTLRLQRRSFQYWKTPLILLGVVVISYGLWIPWMGLFGNDLPYLWYYHLLGPWGPGEFAAIDRPVSALFYAASTLGFGETVWPYQVFLLALRWLSGVLVWWVLRLVWPDHSEEASLAAVLFVVYPGFRQNPVALEFILHFFVLDAFLVSLALTLRAASRSRRTVIQLIGSAVLTLSLFFNEYFIGLEILRPIFLWIVTRRDGLRGKEQWKRILLTWLPSAGAVLVFLFWRVVIFSFPTYKPVMLETLRSTPVQGLILLAQRAAQDLWTTLVAAWVQTLQLPESRRLWLPYAGLLAMGAVLTFTLLWRRWTETAEPRAHFWGEIALGIGILSMLAGGAIFWLTNIPVTLDFPWDRSTLPFMFGACLAAAGLMDMLVMPRYRPALAAALVALAVGLQFINAYQYRQEWLKLQDFIWEFTWRAPELQSGTLALFDVIPLNRYSDNDLTALLNWTYAPGSHSRTIDYKFFDLTLRLGLKENGLPVEKGQTVEHNQRGTYFKTVTDKTLALTYTPPACLKILSPDDASLPGLPERIRQVLPMTDLQQVRVDGASQATPPAIFGPEPAHGWCYYFEKADLAVQRGDWNQAAALGDEAFGKNFQPGDPAELLPFIEGYARSGKLDRAKVLSQQAGSQAELRPALCTVWKRVGEPAFETMREELGCQP
jgi:hypothetical protein